MQLYSCKVRLSGSLYNEVPKTDITAAEITVLRVIHGNDAVADIKATGSVKRTDAEERGDLTRRYGKALRAFDDIKSLNGIFGVAGALPKELPGAEKAEEPKKPARGRPKVDKADLAEDETQESDLDDLEKV